MCQRAKGFKICQFYNLFQLMTQSTDLEQYYRYRSHTNAQTSQQPQSQPSPLSKVVTALCLYNRHSLLYSLFFYIIFLLYRNLTRNSAIADKPHDAFRGQSRWSRLVHSMRQLVSFKDLWRRIFAQSSDEKERKSPSCSKGCLSWFNGSTLSCSRTVLSRLMVIAIRSRRK